MSMLEEEQQSDGVSKLSIEAHFAVHGSGPFLMTLKQPFASD